MSNILFLDIDGVLTSPRIHRAYKDTGQWWRFDPVAVQFLKRIVDEYDLKIVFSTTWRKIYEIKDDPFFNKLKDFEKYSHLASYEQLRIRFYAEGFKESNFHNDVYTPWKLSRSRLRGYEIQEWLEDHPEIKNYIIIDDMPANEMLQDQQDNFVNTCFDNGLTVWEMRKIEKLANSFILNT